MRTIAPSLAIILFACSGTPRQDDPKELRRRLRQQTDELTRLRNELIKARIEILELHLKEARRLNQPKEEIRILLEEGLDSEFIEVKRHAFRAFAGFPIERRKEVLPAVLERWKKGDDRYKIDALPFLGRFPDDPGALEAVLGAARDSSTEVRRTAASVLKTTMNEPALKSLIALLKDPAKDVKLAAVDALGVAKRDGAVEALTEFVKSERENDLVEKGVDALGIVGNASALPTLLALLERGPESVQWSCINSLGKIGDAAAAEKIRPFLDPKRSRQLREVAVASLGKLKDAASLAAFEDLLRKDTEVSLRVYAAEAIRRVGDAGAVERTLLPAYLEEKDEKVRKAIWESLLAMGDARFDVLEKVALQLLQKNMRPELEEIGSRLHDIAPGKEIRDRYVALEEKIAQAAFDAKAWREALGHYKNLVKHVPDHWEGYRRMARCYLEQGDAEGALKALQDPMPRLPRGERIWWDVRKDMLDALIKLNDPVRTLEETQPLFNNGSPPIPEDLRKAFSDAYAAAAARFVEILGSADETVRKAGVEGAKRLGKKAVRILADTIENANAKAAHRSAIEAGNAITQTAVDPATADAAKLKEAAAAWRAWYDKNK